MGDCSFGNVTSSRSVRAATLDLTDADDVAKFVLPFDFAWTVRKFSLFDRHELMMNDEIVDTIKDLWNSDGFY